MASPIRIFFILPIIFFVIIAGIQLLTGTFLSLVLWSFVALISFLICWPLVVRATMKYVPIYQIFSLYAGFVALVIIFTFLDLSKYTTFSQNKLIILAALFGSALSIAILFIHGKRE
jgi:hypothetical protein